jgi:pimeloyl-ACP methyl ester carboxylesterase
MVDFENAVAGHPESPHVIAHSFGTYLMGRALRKFPEAKFSRIVFVGCVLPCTFAWERILMDKKSAFEDVRNEQGLKDWVVLLAGLAGWFTWDIGCAGWRGFKGSKNFIHNGNRPMDPCTKCETLAAAAPVHNIPLKEFLHSDHFLGSRHAQKLWLPFLWGFSPQEYEDYLIPCWDAAYSQQEGLSDDLADREEKLRKRVWTWTSSTGTLEEHIKRHIILELTAMSQPLPPDGKLMDKIDVVVFHLYWLVIDAFQESEKKGHRNLELIAALHPRTAISRAVKEALEL